MNATIRSFVTASGHDRLKEGQAKQIVGNQCTELEYNVFSQDSSAQVELYAEGPCINLGLTFLFNSAHALLDSSQFSPILSASVTVIQTCNNISCSEENGTESNMWIGVANTTNQTEYVVSNCVFDYCAVNISLSNPDEQCAYNRSGVLCGKCKSNFSLVLVTSNCKECSNLYLLLLIPFALAGILLVGLILLLNITIATGNIHGLIFYANIVAANRAILI